MLTKMSLNFIYLIFFVSAIASDVFANIEHRTRKKSIDDSFDEDLLNDFRSDVKPFDEHSPIDFHDLRPFNTQRFDINRETEQMQPRNADRRENWSVVGQHSIDDNPFDLGYSGGQLGQQHVPVDFSEEHLGQQHVPVDFSEEHLGQQHVPVDLSEEHSGQQHVPIDFSGESLGQQNVPLEHQFGQQNVPIQFSGGNQVQQQVPVHFSEDHLGQQHVPVDFPEDHLGQQHVPVDFPEDHLGQQHVPVDFPADHLGQQHVPVDFPEDHLGQQHVSVDFPEDHLGQQHVPVDFPEDHLGQQHVPVDFPEDHLGQQHVPVDFPEDHLGQQHVSVDFPEDHLGQQHVPIDTSEEQQLNIENPQDNLHQQPSNLSGDKEDADAAESQHHIIVEVPPGHGGGKNNIGDEEEYIDEGQMFIPFDWEEPADQQIVNGQLIQKPSTFRGGCPGRPPVPINAALKCSLYGGCRATCLRGYAFPSGEQHLYLTCEHEEWQVRGSKWRTLPPCQPVCLPSCQNNGICIGPNQCNCPDNYGGAQCQYEKKPCLDFPPIPANSRRVCTLISCTVTCMNGYEFPDGSSITNMMCKSGDWVPARQDWVTVPDCKATCHPECQNGGACLAHNTCQCSLQYRGPQCQYDSDRCTAEKLNFNGIYNCSGNSDQYSCSLSCPPGISFDSAPVDTYTCYYSTGTFQPQPVPSCVYGENVDVIPIEVSSHTFYIPGQSNVVSSHTKPSSGTDPDITALFEEKVEPSPGICLAWNERHYKTFDGLVYSFESSCSYRLVEDSLFQVDVDGSICDGKSCHKILSIYYQDQHYKVSRDEYVPILLINQALQNIPYTSPELTATIEKNSLVLRLLPVDVEIEWDVHEYVTVKIEENNWNRTRGICGSRNKVVNDDFMTREGFIVHNVNEFVDSWKVEDTAGSCSADPVTFNQQDTNSSGPCDLLKSPELAGCISEVLNSQPYYDACLWDVRKCGHQCACQTVRTVVVECEKKGRKTIENWRRLTNCDMICHGGRQYQSCGPEYEMTCRVQDRPVTTNKVACVEGCFCPDGTVLHHHKCVPKNQCPCQLRGKEFHHGDKIPKGCNTCSCEEGKWTCSEENCGSRCSSIGDPHYVTFDGKRYDFMGQCSYYLLKTENYTIEAENVVCEGTISNEMNYVRTSNELPSCTKSVTISAQGDVLNLKLNRQIYFNDVQVHKLPVTLGNFLIRDVSSIFMMVTLSNGIDVWWDGLARLYLDAPADLQGKTEGLCGTFNFNQKDDFLTPEKDIEHSVTAFANKWKTNEKCRDVQPKTGNHPCDANIENRQKAELYCKKLKSDLFQSCHWYVDVESYYKDCLFDVCSCNKKFSACLCPILAEYANECARQGVALEWRSHVRECGVHCSGGQVYQACGNSCTRSCQDISLGGTTCRRQCVEGCNCPGTLSLDQHGECVPVSQCPCIHKGLDYKPGHKIVIEDYKGPQFCLCENAKWSCRDASTNETKEFSELTELKAKCAAESKEYIDCEPVEQKTCKNMHSKNKQTDHQSAECTQGCVCRKGFVLDYETNNCIKPTQCPCHHGGISYSNGQTIQDDCNTCSCVEGKWNCTDKICPGICSVWGDTHFKTFDDKIFDFQGSCYFVLAKGHISDHEEFEIIIQVARCGSSGVSCFKSLTFKIAVGERTEEITFKKGKQMPHVKLSSAFVVRESGSFIFAETYELGVVVQWDKETRVYVKIDPKWRNKVKGLCGNYNDNEEDDWELPTGGLNEVSVGLFADSWRLQSYCPESVPIQDACAKNKERRSWAIYKCDVLKSHLFEPCHSEVPLDPYIERCVTDACGCDEGGDCDCLCSAIAAYAQECNIRGVPIKWRTPQLCPIQCDPSCSEYSPCISACPQLTCENQYVHSRMMKMCAEDACVEGCKKKECPSGEIHTTSDTSECIPQAACRTVCIQEHNVTYYEGDVMIEDGCHTCTCSRHQKICTGKPCPTDHLISTTLPPITEQRDGKISCQSGWSTWINQHHPTQHKDLSDVEPLPTNSLLNSLGSKSVCDGSQMTKIRCRSAGGKKEHKLTGEDVECSLEKGLLCLSSNQTCQDYEISVFCDCGDLTTPPSMKTTETLPYNIDIPTLTCHSGWTKWINSHYPNSTGEFEVLADIRQTHEVCPDWAVEKTECRAVGDIQTSTPRCTKNGVVCLHPKGSFCPDFEVRYKCNCECSESLKVSSHKITTSSGDGTGAVINSHHVWRPLDNQTPQQWIQVEFDKLETVTGVELQGDPVYPHWTTSFTISHSKDGTVWSLILESFNRFQILRGNSDQNSITKVYLEKNITAKYVRLIPLSYHGGISLRFDILGCPQELLEPEETLHEVPQLCNSLRPHHEHPFDCHLFLHCVDTPSGPMLVEKSCGNNMMFNPVSQICDWPAEVQTLKPSCRKLRTTPAPEICIDGWTEWINVSYPGQSGEFETRDEINKSGITLCSNIEDVECKFYRGTQDRKGIKTTGQVLVDYKQSKDKDVVCSVEHGLECQNSRQTDGPCHDYLIRFKCSCDLTSTTTVATTSHEIPQRCNDGEVWDECAIKCDRVCDYYGHFLISKGLCHTSTGCISGCRNESWHSCPPDKWLRDANTCVEKRDCTCQSHNGHLMKPGIIHQESDCEVCQCINNHYECDTSSCVVRQTTSSTSVNTVQGSNKEGVTLPTLVEGAQGDVIIIVRSTVAPTANVCPLKQLNSLIKGNNKVHLTTGNGHDIQSDIWTAHNNDLDQFLQVDLGAVHSVEAVTVTAGAHHQYVTSYHLLFSSDGVTFSYVMDSNNLLEVLRGPVDEHKSVRHILPTPIEARYIRFNPRTWHLGISMRVDVLGCGELTTSSFTGFTSTTTTPTCLDSLLTPTLFLNHLVQVSSSRYNSEEEKLEWTSDGVWQPLLNSKTEWVKVDFQGERVVTGIKTKGLSQSNDLNHFIAESWVEAFVIQYSKDGTSWSTIQDDLSEDKVFLGNFDGDTSRTVFFDRPVHARFVKFLPIKWHNEIALKLDLIGCFQSYDVTTTTQSTTAASPSCQICRGANVDIDGPCPCTRDLWWDGGNCVNQTNCPCYIGHISYPVGTTFESEDCQHCTCRVYGLTHCEPKICPSCPENLQSVLTATCSCICNSCPKNTRLCPSSNVCVKISSWCDGVEDCPDDELNCTTKEQPKACPVPECPPDHVLVEKTTNEGQSESATKSKQTIKKALPGKLVCPEYECVLNILAKTCPLQTCPPLFKVVLTENATSDHTCPVFSCQPTEPEHSTCEVTSNLFTTFDGLTYKYEVCDNVLVKDDLLDDWKISLAKICTDSVSCTLTLTINLKQRVFKIFTNLTVEIDGYEYTHDQVNILNNKDSKEFQITKMGDTIVYYSNTHQFEVMFDKQGAVEVKVPSKLKNQLTGMCGNYNGKPADDKMSPSGKITDNSVEFGDSWMSEHAKHCEAKVCPLHLQTRAWTICNAIREEPFKVCSGIIDTHQFVAKCLESVCNCLTSSDTDDSQCRCQALLNYVTECKRVDYDKDLSTWRILHDCPAICPSDLVHHDCYSSTCEPTCENPTCSQLPSSFCFPGCYCPEGLVRKGDRCVKLSECRGCVCNSLGDTQYLNYDRTIFTVNTNCTYVATRDVPRNDVPNFQVLIQNGRCRLKRDGVCTNSVLVHVKGHSIRLKTVEEQDSDEIEVKVDGKMIEHNKFPYIDEWIHMDYTPGKEVSVVIQSFNLEVLFNYKTRSFSITVPYHVYSNRLEGLCGNCNKDETDDLVDSQKIPVETMDEFGKAWLVKTQGYEYCTKPGLECLNQDYDINMCERMLRSSLFDQCHTLIDPTRYIELCQAVTCFNGSLCSSIEAYSQACNEMGLCLDWRSVTPDCGLTCPPGLTYQHCVSGCTKTCETLDHTETCTLKPRDGCFCPKEKVLHNGTCVDIKTCHYCDNDGHYEGDTWNVDKCTTCSCTNKTVHCSKTECSSLETVCEQNYTPIVVAEQSDDVCCPKYVCAPLPTERPTCPEEQTPECGYGQIKKMDIDSNGCYRFTCRCKPPEECDEIHFPDEVELLPGMERKINKSGCCPRLELVCRPDSCPEPEPCKLFYNRVQIPGSGCCPTYDCEKPKDKCIYTLEYTENENGGEKLRNAQDKETILQNTASEWNDGPCRKCQCYRNGQGVKVSCTRRECTTIDKHPDRYEYMLKTVWGTDKCCPEFERTACKHNKKNYEINESWFPVEENRCETMTCVKSDGGVVRETRVDTCNTHCEYGWKYVKHDEKVCCGSCVQAGCLIDNVLYEPGQTWASIDNCTRYTCVPSAGTFQIVSSSEQCPNLEHCPPENVYQDVCCRRCNFTTESKRLCALEELPPESTIQLIKEYQKKHGKCVNKEPIHHFTECIGTCQSRTFYNPENWSHGTSCQCCQIESFKAIDVNLTCEDGEVINKRITIPSACSCMSCGNS